MKYIKSLKSYLEWHKQVAGDEIFLDEGLPKNFLTMNSGQISTGSPTVMTMENNQSLHSQFCSRTQKMQTENPDQTASPITFKRPPHPLKESPALPNMESLYAYIKESDLYKRKGKSFDIVLPNGPLECRLAVVSMVPGTEDGVQGTVFQGQDGRLLDKMLASINIKRSEVYCTSIVKNLDLHPFLSWREKGRFVSLSYRELSFVKAKFILLMGEKCCQNFLKSGRDLKNFRKVQHPLDKIDILKGKTALATFHPGFLNKYDKFKHHAWDDLKWIQAVL